ncbi:MAG: hypothetical protein ABW092_15375 [Candidatus Thiodiazotropha sp.]
MGKKKNQIVTFFEQTYQLKINQEECGVVIILAKRLNPGQKECLDWDDFGHVANVMVKQGIVSDHSEALILLNSIYADGSG